MKGQTINIPFTTEVMEKNFVTGYEIRDDVIIIEIEPFVKEYYSVLDCEGEVEAKVNSTYEIIVSELGFCGKRVFYRVKMIQCEYVNDEGIERTFTIDVPGVRGHLGVTDSVVERAMYFLIDRNETLQGTVELLWDLHGVRTSTSSLDRWKADEANKLPSEGVIIKLLNEKVEITQLHIDEYKAKRGKGWIMVLKDQEGRILLQRHLKRRDNVSIGSVLRYMRMLGIYPEVIYCDFWLGYPEAIRKVYPNAKVQYDYFHIIQNILKHLYKEFTIYRKRFKAAKTEKEFEEIHKQMHKKLWKNRYKFLKNKENLTDEEKEIIDEILQEHPDSVLGKILTFKEKVREIFLETNTKLQASLKLFDLIASGWSDVSDNFRKIIDFLRENFPNMITFLGDKTVRRCSLSETGMRSLRRIEVVRDGFKSKKGRLNHFKLFQVRSYLTIS